MSDIPNHMTEPGMKIEQSSSKCRIPSQRPTASEPGTNSRSGKKAKGMKGVPAEAVSSILQAPG